MRLVTALSALLLASFAAAPAVGQGQGRDDLANLKSLLLQLKVNPYPPPRERSAQLVVAVVRRMDVSTIDRATIDEIAGHLEDNSDVVRGRMAIALGNIGDAAKHTVPALEKAFVRAKEHVASTRGSPPPRGYRNYGGGTSADGICFALQRLEAASPPGCVDGRYDAEVEPSASGLPGQQP